MNSKQNNQVTKKQHMVAEVVQKQFSYDGRKVYGIREIHISGKDNKCAKIKYDINNFSINNIMWADSCYELPLGLLNNQNINLLENSFAEIESKYNTILDNINGMIERKLSFEELKQYINGTALYYFLFFYFRTKIILFYGNNKKEKEKQQYEICNRLNNILLDHKYIKDLASTIKNCYRLSILESPSNGFLLSDSFISTASIDYKGILLEKPFYLNRTIGLKNIVILIPISSKYYLLFSDNRNYTKSNYMKIYDKDLLLYNSIIYRNSLEFTIGERLAILKEVENKVKKYHFLDMAGGSVQKPEIWVNEEIDKIYYHIDSANLEKLSRQAVGFTRYSNKNGKLYTVEKNLQELTNNVGAKLISRNPNF